MKKYFYLQAKLTARYLPFVLAVSLALALGMGIVMTGVMSFFENDGSRKDFAVAVTGDTDNLYLQNVGQILGADLTDEEREMIFSKNAQKILDRSYRL